MPTSKQSSDSRSRAEIQESIREHRDRHRSLNDAISEEEEELNRLRERSRKGDPEASAQIAEQRETVETLRKQRSTEWARLRKARRQLHKAGGAPERSRRKRTEKRRRVETGV